MINKAQLLVAIQKYAEAVAENRLAYERKEVRKDKVLTVLRLLKDLLHIMRYDSTAIDTISSEIVRTEALAEQELLKRLSK